jgi:hypothetical protein
VTKHTSRLLWATAHMSLGGAFGERIEGERAENIEQAIDHFVLAQVCQS